MIEHGADCFDTGFVHACQNGHMDIVKLMIDMGVKSWDDGVHEAISGDHVDIVILISEKGFISKWEKIYKYVEKHRDPKLCKLLIDRLNKICNM
jgi:hypothetical protein